MRWLDRLLSRDGPYVATRINAIAELGTRVELCGEVEPLELLHDPIDGEPAVVLNYHAHRPGLAQRYFSIQATEGAVEAYQGTNFLLRDDSGTALIQVQPGANLGKLHDNLRNEFGVDLRASIERIGPGDRVRVRGRVAERTDEGSPHRREPWCVVVILDELEDA
ncbi:hypothetical protein DB30_05744 [Enhygromyxa salina]|uniref:Uncharacterized protein n=1 Tax=Enhygromyxa salina TaxID=215803 RepID=A0A0C2D5J5_9BACT|nr:hypothetical protein [Enhygromyxa salina]KIG15317.1 hypothetical protein DB30_05744 [Enhygromyxa salina]